MALSAVIALLTIIPRPRVAVALLVALALSGAHVLWRLIFVVPLPENAGPAETIAFTLAAAPGAAFVAALWHARHRWSVGSAPQRAS